jgi:hypothetical protein
MHARDFVAAIRHLVIDASVTDTVTAVQAPPGRRPAVELVELSAWFHALSDADRDMVKRMLAMVAHGAVFGLFAVLDGARKIDPAEAPEDHFELRHVHGTSEDVLSGPSGETLHALL